MKKFPLLILLLFASTLIVVPAVLAQDEGGLDETIQEVLKVITTKGVIVIVGLVLFFWFWYWVINFGLGKVITDEKPRKMIAIPLALLLTLLILVPIKDSDPEKIVGQIFFKCEQYTTIQGVERCATGQGHFSWFGWMLVQAMAAVVAIMAYRQISALEGG